MKSRWFYNDWLAFNEFRRDAWVREQISNIESGSTVLDVGAGSAPYREALLHCEYKTQDFSALFAEQLRGGGYTQVDYVCDASQIPVQAASFDVVICTEMLEHVPEPIKVVTEIGRILKPGGRLILTAPLGSGLHQEPYHYYGGYTPYWYERFLRQAGFVDIEVTPNAGFFRLYGQESIRFLRMLAPKPAFNPALLLWLPFWLGLVPLFGVALPLLCRFLDRFDRQPRFTVGYFVKARRLKEGDE